MKTKSYSLQIKGFSLILLFMVALFSVIPAYSANLFIDPASPFVQVGGEITLTVTNAGGEVMWSAFKGEIEKTGTSVSYQAPDKIAIDVVTAMDTAGNSGTVTVVVQEKDKIDERFSKENANWEIFTNRSVVKALLLSDNKETLWVAAEGGLEERESVNGELKRVYSNQSGLPDNQVNSIISDNQGGLWAATFSGVSHLKSDGTWQVFNESNSDLPDNRINTIISDNQGGIWLGSETGGLAYCKQDKKDGVVGWKKFNKDNSDLPSDNVQSLLLDGQGGLWAGTWGGGLAHLKPDAESEEFGICEIFNKDNSKLPDNDINALVSDGQGGLWIGIGYYAGFGLGHLKADGALEIFNKDNSKLPDNRITTLLLDGYNGLWIGTRDGGLAYLKQKEAGSTARGAEGVSEIWEWEIFNKDNPNIIDNRDNANLLDNHIRSIISDGQDGLWIGTDIGFGHLTKTTGSSWEISNICNTRFPNDKCDTTLPNNSVKSLVSDGKGGIWAGTEYGLAHRKSDNTWEIFNSNNSDLPDNVITALVSDGQGGLWVGNGYYDIGGLSHLKSDGKWEVFNTDNSYLPDNVITALVSDTNGGLWVGTRAGLGHLKSNSSWEIFDKNSFSYSSFAAALQENWITAICYDDQGGIWVGMGFNSTVRLGHLKPDRSWDIFDETNSSLTAGNDITSLLSDGKGGIWVGTWGSGLLHRKSDSTWEVINTHKNQIESYGLTSFAGLPSDYISSILSDGQNGIWVGTEDKGLGRLKSDGIWEKFDENNSDLQNNNAVNSLLSDGNGGLWVGTFGGGLAHLTFSSSQIQNEQYLKNGRAAIIIAGGGNTDDNALWDCTVKISNYAYKMLIKRCFLNTDIHYISPQPFADFNGDGLDDKIVDSPTPARQINVSDIQAAFEWAAAKGSLNQPLYIFFTDHGGDSRLQLAKGVYIEAAELKAMLDNYQKTTGNKVIVIIDACHSGTMVKALAGENRAVISSTDDGVAYFDRLNGQSFIWYVTKGLNKGMDFSEAFYYASSEYKKALGKISQYESISAGIDTVNITQEPQFDDTGDGLYNISVDGNWLKTVSVNGTWSNADVTLTVEAVTQSGIIPASNSADLTNKTNQNQTPTTLKAKAVLANGRVTRAWAVIRPPKMDILFDSTTGTPILAFPKVDLSASKTVDSNGENSGTEEQNIYQGSWNGFVYNGEYEITFYAQDNQGNVESSESIILTVADGLACPERGSLKVSASGNSINDNLANPDAAGKIVYKSGDKLKISVTENLAYGYDLYAALFMPDGNFTAIKNTLTDGNISYLQKENFNRLYWGDRWIDTNRNINMGRAVDVVDLTLPQEKLPSGQYCVYAALIPEGQDLVAAANKGLIVLDGVCFEVETHRR